MLEGEKKPRLGTRFRLHREQVLAVEERFAFQDFVAFAAGQDVGERALARAVGAHEGMDFACGDVQIEPVEDAPTFDGDGEVAYREHHPTDPSRLTSRSLPASTANSSGSFWNTSLQNPPTMRATARSGSMPRWRQ